MATTSEVTFTLNGELHAVDVDEAAGKTLNEYIRFRTRFTGTKLSCAQGGCGACTVALARPGQPALSATSCLLPLASLHGAAVLTADGLGKDGQPHPIAERVARFGGSQCGFCTPGMVMQLYSTLSSQDGGKACHEKDLEQCINGNICRCTGYRPIMEAAKSFAADTTVRNHICPGTPVGPYDVSAADPSIVFPPTTPPLVGKRWLRPTTVIEVFRAMSRGARLLAGATAAGVYPDLGMAEGGFAGQLIADISGVKELTEFKIEGENLRVGALVTWTSFTQGLRRLAAGHALPNPGPLLELAERTGIIAGSQIRNCGTIGGNVAITRARGFLSDWVPLLAALGAKVEVRGGLDTGYEWHDLLHFVQQDTPYRGLITAVILPLPKPHQIFRSYRLAKRSHNAHALVNAGFSAMLLDGRLEQVCVVVGAVDPKPVRMRHLERELSGLRGQDLQAHAHKVLASLSDKVSSDVFPMACGFGREQTLHVLHGFVVKFLTAALGAFVPKEWASAEYGLHDMPRSSAASQTFPTPTDIGGELNKPMVKHTAVEQAMGVAKFTDDVPKPIGTLLAAYVVCPEANVVVRGFDRALGQRLLGDAFHSLLTAEDLSLKSLNVAKIIGFHVAPDFVEGHESEVPLLATLGQPVLAAGTPVALLLARGDNPRAVERAAAAMSESLQLERLGAPLLGNLVGGGEITAPLVTTKGKGNVDEIIAKAKAAGGGGYISGKFTKSSQVHFYMEGQSVLVVPEEDGLTVYVACQSTETPQIAVAKATGLKQSKIVVKYKRVGGGFGGKLVIPSLLAAVAAQAARKAGLPVRLVLPREVDMMMTGGRQEIEAPWEAAVDPQTGRILALKYDIWMCHGVGENTQKINGHLISAVLDEVYAVPDMRCAVHNVFQHVSERTAVRAPGHLEAVLLMEAVIDGVATELKLPGHVVRERNFFRGSKNTSNLKGALLPQGHLDDYSVLALWDRLKAKVQYDTRYQAVQDFNRSNTWKKRGIAISPARYGMALSPGNAARVDIFKDGSVQVAVSGSEIGQGLHVKVAQMVNTMFARELGHGPPLGAIRFVDTSTEQNPNGPVTGGSTTSEGAMFAAGDAVRQLVERLRPAVKKAKALGAEARNAEGPWFDIVAEIFSTKFLGVLVVPPNLSAVGHHLTPPTEIMYETYGVAATEVELDVLTGEWRVLMSHLMFDIGMSYNPMVDIGQMEGAFIMGLGQVQNEGLDFDQATGRLLSDNTWTYKPPIATDVPEHFSVELCDLRRQRLNNATVTCMMGVVGSLLGFCGVPWKPTKTKSIYKSAKAIGEPPVLLASSLASALHDAVVAATGRALPEHSLPIPAKPFALLPLLEAQRPGANLHDDTSTATGTSAASVNP